MFLVEGRDLLLNVGDELKWLIAGWALDAELIIDPCIDTGYMP